MTIRDLVLSPHADDEVLGCASVLGPQSQVIYVGIEDFHVVTREERLHEISDVAEFLGFHYDVLAGHTVNRYAVPDLIGQFEEIVNRIQPERVFIPYQHSYNQDHRAVFQAAQVATRPHDRNHFVRTVLMYEESDVLWGAIPFQANCFIPLDLDRKLEGLRRHKSQMRGHRSFDLIEAIARIRGEQSGTKYSEAFHSLRHVTS